MTIIRIVKYLFMPVLLSLSMTISAQQPSAEQIILDAINHERDTASYSVITMTIHRPDWQRTMTMKSWTKGMKKSLVRVVEPKKDAGSGNLLLDENMWSYAPKINRVIKLPSSMMNQSWMGSDFTNNDLAKADDILEHYQHTLKEVRQHENKKLYIIESVPKDAAPVVWGKEIVQVREDRIMLGHDFYDQDGKLVKRLKVNSLERMGGKLVASSIRMVNVEQPDKWTEVEIKEARFGISIPERVFTLSNLRNPRQGY